MANRTQDRLFESFQALLSDQNGGLASLADFGRFEGSAAGDGAAPIGASQTGDASSGMADVIRMAVEDATRPINQPVNRSTSSGASGIGSEVASGVAQVFTSGLGLVPLVSGLLGLFGGGGSSEPPPLVKYTLPAALSFEGADTGTGVGGADYDQFGMPRLYAAAERIPQPVTGASPIASAFGGPSVAAPQITVNVQAMDSRSFLDHSTEIAQAVRQAMLNLSPINDVVNDL